MRSSSFAARRGRRARLLGLAVAWFVALMPASAAAQSVSFGQIKPFVTGLIPVIGPRGTVGGVAIDARGVVARAEVDRVGRLGDLRLSVLSGVDADMRAASRLRKVSLRGLVAAIDERRRAGLPVSGALQNLAGLQRVQYVFVYPERGDIVLAGPAEAWQLDAEGNVVGQTTGRSVLQLDDLLVALRTARQAATGDGITCSIDPTKEGSLRVRRILGTRGLEVNEALIARLERSAGPQQVTLTGVPPDSHFAQVLVAADYMMKCLGMNLEPAPIEGLPSYLEMLQASSRPAPRHAMPRWWMAPHYEPLLADAEGLAFELRASGVRTLSEDGYLAADGTVVAGRGDDPLAEKWATAMTERYEELSAAMPIFGQLRNCMELAVVAALLAKEDLPRKANCDLALLLDDKQVKTCAYPAPKTIDSRASLVRKDKQWIVSVSGGVDLDSWAVLDQVRESGDLAKDRAAAAPADAKRWWWD